MADRENEINAFVPKEYWSLGANVITGKNLKPVEFIFTDDKMERPKLDEVMSAVNGKKMIVDTVIYKGNNINIHSYTKQAKGTVYTYYRARLIVEKGKTISIQGNTIEECKNKIYYAINIHAFVPGYNNLEITIGEAMPAWLKMRYANGRPSTYIRYKATMKHIIEYTGQKRIQNLSPEDVQSFADHLSSISLSGVYIHAAISLLKRFLQEYVDRGEIPYNPCLHVQMPTIDTPEASPFTKKDIQIILDNLSGTKYKNAIKLSLLTAMRIGEVLGLTWDKVDFANKTITIDQQIHHGSSEILPYVKNHNPKTVHYPQEVFDLLSEVKQQQDSLARFAGELWDNPSNLIFTTEFGKPIPHPSILEAFKKAAERYFIATDHSG